jgi:hypothetical protein
LNKNLNFKQIPLTQIFEFAIFSMMERKNKNKLNLGLPTNLIGLVLIILDRLVGRFRKT